MTEHYDVAIIGAGTAGLTALGEIKKGTDNYVLINEGPYGTTCARVGCMPSKALIEASRAYHKRVLFNEFGFKGADALTADIPAVLAHVRKLRDAFVSGTLKLTDKLGDHNISGHARFISPDTLSVNDRTIQAKKIIIATGSRPVVPEAWRSFGDRLLTTDSLFEQTDLPPTIAVIGMGPVGAEMALALSRLGIKIDAFDLATRIAGLADSLVSDKAIAYLQREFALHLGSPVELSPAENGVRVKADGTEIVVDKFLAALGRRPNIDDIGLENLGVPLDKRGLPPFDPCNMQIADLPVFITGDSSNRSPFMHEAADEGYIAGMNALSAAPVKYARRTPLAIVFSDPEIAMVGQRFSNLQADKIIIGEADFTQQGRAITAGANRGVIRLYADKESGLILGAEMCAPEGEHLAHLLALAIQQKLSVRDLLGMPYYHPVIEEGLRNALRDLAHQLAEKGFSDLARCEGSGNNTLD
jgi:dihydrolipoamide dehydrogenase